MFKLGEPLGWDQSYRESIRAQDDFLEELNITTYNSFKDYLFWDVIEALSKVHLVNTDMKSDATGAGRIQTEEDIFQSEGSYIFAGDD
jgi:tRNA(Leu) C34 or U34 (ribose-2'-O)-methylase TrmL